MSRHHRCSCRCHFESGLGTYLREQHLQLVAARVVLHFQYLVCLSLPVLVLEQHEYACWGWLPLPAPPASATPSTTPSSASAASPTDHGGTGAAQRWWQRGGRSVQCTCSYGTKQHSGDPDTGDAALSAHGGKSRGCSQRLCPPGPLLTSKAAWESPGLEIQS